VFDHVARNCSKPAEAGVPCRRTNICAPRAFSRLSHRESGVNLIGAPAASEQHPAVHPENANFE
jgi:hypothetical protein